MPSSLGVQRDLTMIRVPPYEGSQLASLGPVDPPVNVIPPTIVDDGPGGTISNPITGDTLRCSDNGTWDNNPTSFTYQWYLGPVISGMPIPGATNSTLSLISDYIGSTASCQVTANNSAGSTPAASTESGIIQSS